MPQLLPTCPGSHSSLPHTPQTAGSKNLMHIYPPNRTLHLSNIPPSTSDGDLTALFANKGKVTGFRRFPFVQGRRREGEEVCQVINPLMVPPPPSATLARTSAWLCCRWSLWSRPSKALWCVAQNIIPFTRVVDLLSNPQPRNPATRRHITTTTWTTSTRCGCRFRRAICDTARTSPRRAATATHHPFTLSMSDDIERVAMFFFLSAFFLSPPPLSLV